MAINTEDLTKALQGLELVQADLQAALRDATPVESILVLRMVRDAVHLRDAVQELRAALADGPHREALRAGFHSAVPHYTTGAAPANFRS